MKPSQYPKQRASYDKMGGFVLALQPSEYVQTFTPVGKSVTDACDGAVLEIKIAGLSYLLKRSGGGSGLLALHTNR